MYIVLNNFLSTVVLRKYYSKNVVKLSRTITLKRKNLESKLMFALKLKTLKYKVNVQLRILFMQVGDS